MLQFSLVTKKEKDSNVPQYTAIDGFSYTTCLAVDGEGENKHN